MSSTHCKEFLACWVVVQLRFLYLFLCHSVDSWLLSTLLGLNLFQLDIIQLSLNFQGVSFRGNYSFELCQLIRVKFFTVFYLFPHSATLQRLVNFTVYAIHRMFILVSCSNLMYLKTRFCLYPLLFLPTKLGSFALVLGSSQACYVSDLEPSRVHRFHVRSHRQWSLSVRLRRLIDL